MFGPFGGSKKHRTINDWRRPFNIQLGLLVEISLFTKFIIEKELNATKGTTYN